MNTIANTFKSTPAPVVRRENTQRIQGPVKRGQIYQNSHGYWRVDLVMGGLADLLPVFADGSPRPALPKRVESIANLNGPLYKLQPAPVVDRGNSDPVGWALIMLVVIVLGMVAWGLFEWRAGV